VKHLEPTACKFLENTTLGRTSTKLSPRTTTPFVKTTY
jgi:hypothetical protein